MGVGFRRGLLSDAAAIVDVHLRSAEHDGADATSVVDPVPTIPAMQQTLASLKDVARDLTVVEEDGLVVGYGYIRYWREQDGTVVYLHRGLIVPPARGRGAGTELIARLELQISETARCQNTTARAVFGANASDSESDAMQLLENNGYHLAFTQVEMCIADLQRHEPCAAPRLSEAVTITPLQVADQAAAFRVIADSYRDWGTVAEFDDADIDDMFRSIAPECSLVLCADGEVAGVILCERRADIGVVEELSVSPSFQRRGYGRVLLHAALAAMKQQGCASSRLTTGTDNPTRSFDLYESAGFVRIRNFGRYRKPVKPGGVS